ncbi:corrinoid adenosyltransferase [Anaeramoeba ignava]|uniref:Corrinoid adenosyltransferase n=1 Tax=Anaeramoeba ignava TaxID=1746090 RepID=A0A9Q0LP40_ANAIG|nr:corrinoid adenosyltransferase [Anaeramoeba ignava]
MIIRLARTFCKEEMNPIHYILQDIQSLLIEVGASIATPQKNSIERVKRKTHFDEKHIKKLEDLIDEIDTKLPKLTKFILPSGGKSSSFLHVSRSVCRRAERRIVALADDIDPNILKFINRLSDLLFQLSRLSAKNYGEPEIVHKKVEQIKNIFLKEKEKEEK